MNKIKCNFSLKGNRDYIQGGDIFDNVYSYLLAQPGTDIQTIKFAIVDMAHSDCELIAGDLNEPVNRPENGIARINVSCKQGSLCLWVNETFSPVQGRIEFPEEQIVGSSIMTDKQITLDKNPGFSTMESLVSLTKKLHQTAFSDLKGKWIFVQLHMDRSFKQSFSNSVSVSLKNTRNPKLTSSEIAVDGEVCGTIFFSLIASN